MARGKKGFTLLELLVVLGVILTLAAIAAPKLLNIQVRGKVVVARSHTQTLARSLELYASDHLQYPLSFPRFPQDPLGILSVHQLSALTTPAAYLSGAALFDPFGVIESQVYDPSLTSSNDFPQLEQPNAQRSLLYFYYPSLAERKAEPSLGISGAASISIGPDRKDSMGAYRPFGIPFFAHRIPPFIARHPYDTVYGPTNGTSSPGDIGDFAGEGRRFAVP